MMTLILDMIVFPVFTVITLGGLVYAVKTKLKTLI